MSLTFGEHDQVSFTTYDEKYKFIGYLMKQCVYIKWENNDLSGAWGKEGRMAFTDIDVCVHFPYLGYSAGIGTYVRRLNCNEFVKELFDLGFIRGNVQNVSSIRNNIPPVYRAIFDQGYLM